MNRDTKPKNPFLWLNIVELITLLTSILVLIELKLNGVLQFFLPHPAYDILLYVVIVYSLTKLSSSIFLRIAKVKKKPLFPFAMFFAGKIYYNKTGIPLEGKSYSELITKLEEADMIDKPKPKSEKVTLEDKPADKKKFSWKQFFIGLADKTLLVGSFLAIMYYLPVTLSNGYRLIISLVTVLLARYIIKKLFTIIKKKPSIDSK